VLLSVVALLVLAVTGVVVGVREIRAWREVPDFVGAGGTQAVVEVEDGQSLTAIGATLARQNVVASIRAFTRAAEADPRVKEVLARFPGAKVVEVRKLAPEPPESDVSSGDAAEIADGDDQ